MRDLETAEIEPDDESDVVGCLPTVLASSHRQEIAQLVGSLPEVIASEDCSLIENNLERYCKLLKLYQEQPNLLDGYIPELTEQLLRCVDLPTADSASRQLSRLSNAALEYLEHLTTVRGAKVISRLLPHQVSYLDRLLLTLEELSTTVEDGLRERRMLLLWLWIVCKNPFDLRRFDKKDCPGSTLKRIFAAAEPYLSGSLSRCGYVAALVLSQCIGRTDGLLLLEPTVESCLRHLASEKDRLGGLILLAAILKHVDRRALEPIVDRLVASIRPLFPMTGEPNVLIRKFLVKAAQRIALTLLKPRVASWRYRRGKRSLEESLASLGAATGSSNGHAANGTTAASTNGGGAAGHHDHEEQEEEEADYSDVSEHAEWALGCLLEAIKDDDTVVRWSAAKGIGRICCRLPRDLVGQVVDAVVKGNFHRLAGHCSWHGGCMALAELSRRGFLLPEALPKVFDIVQTALFYEEPMGRQALGANVRDAACYILWAFARAYEPEDLRLYVEKVATSLMCVTLFDREVRLRRAASAAFQENVGRQTNFPDGIALLTIADYYAVGNRERCYSRIAKEVSRFDNYTSALIDHLVEKKVVHWDASVRQQTATALSNLSSLHADYIATKLPQLEEGCRSDNPIRRNGCIIALAHTISGLQKAGYSIPATVLEAAAKLPGTLRADFENQRTGELTRTAVTEFLRVLSEVRPPLTEDQVSIWLSLLETACVDRKPAFRKTAAAAAASFIRAYVQPSTSIAQTSGSRFIREICGATLEPTRIGFCSLAGALPAHAVHDELFQALCDTILSHGAADKKWALAREAAVEAVAQLFLEAGLPEKWTSNCLETLLHATDDYTMDIHGDIGRFVRQRAMEGLAAILTAAEQEEEEEEGMKETVRREYTGRAVRKMIQQSAEKIGRTRETACNCLSALLGDPKTSQLIPHAHTLSEIYRDGRDFIQDKALLSLTALFDCEEFYVDIVQGLVFSAGGVSEVTGRYSAEAFLVYQESISGDLQKVERLVATVADLLERGLKTWRLGEAVLRFLPQLLRRLPADENYVNESEAVRRIVSRLTRLLQAAKMSPGRVRMVLNALSSLLMLSPSCQVWKTAVQMLAGALSNPLPVIRRSAAESLLESVWAMDVDERVGGLLSETHWQGTDEDQLSAIMTAADAVRKMLIIPSS